MECKFCKTENVDESTYCKNCGKRIDGKKICPVCKKAVDDDAVYCNYCGSRTDGKKVCPSCETVFEGNFCPKCGSQGRKANVVKYVNNDNGEIVVRAGGGNWKKTVSTIGSAFALFAAVISLIFVFVIGFGAHVNATGNTGDFDFGNLGINVNQNVIIYDYFGKIYETINQITSSNGSSGSGVAPYYTFSEPALLLPAVIGTVVSAGVIIAVITLSVISIIKLARKLSGKEVKNAESTAIAAFLTYVLGSALLLLLNYASVSMTYYSSYSYSQSVNVSAVVSFSDATIAGITLGAIGIATYFACNVACRGQELKDVKTLVNVILTVVAVAFTSIVIGLAATSVQSIQYSSISSSATEKANVSLPSSAWIFIWAEYLGKAPEKWDTEFFLLIMVMFAQIAVVTVGAIAIITQVRAFVSGKKTDNLGFNVALSLLSVIMLILAVVAKDELLYIVHDENVKFTFAAAIAATIFAILNLAVSITSITFANARKNQQADDKLATAE